MSCPFKQFVDKIASDLGYSVHFDIIKNKQKAVYRLKKPNEKNEKPKEQDIVVKIVKYANKKEVLAIMKEFQLSTKWNHPNIVKFKYY